MLTIVACRGHNSCVCVIKFEQYIVPGDAKLQAACSDVVSQH